MSIMNEFNVSNYIRHGNFKNNITCSNCGCKLNSSITKKYNKSKKIIITCPYCKTANLIGDVYNFIDDININTKKLECKNDSNLADKLNWNNDYDNLIIKEK